MTDAAQLAEDARRRADVQEDAGDIDAAICTMSQAVGLAPENPKYRALRGRLFHLQHRWREAIADFDGALAMKPNAATTLYSRARARSMIDDLDGAIADFERCIALQPTAADAFAEIGSIRYYQGELEQALAAYRKAIELEPARQAGIAGRHISEIEEKLQSGR